MSFCVKIGIDGDNMGGIVNLMYTSAIVVWYIVFIIFIGIIYFLNAKPHKSEYKKMQKDSYPSKLKPAELSMLLYKKITPEVFTASVLMLIHKKEINIKKDKEDYILTLNKNSNYGMDKNQKYVIDILFDSIAGSNTVKLSAIEKYANTKENGSEFLTNYYVWRRMAQSETFHTNYYETKMGYRLIVVYKYIAALLVTINFVNNYHWLSVYLLIILSIFLKLFFYKTYKRTKEANDEYHKWKSFKNYLFTFSLEEVELDDEQTFHHLIYGSILGISKYVKNETFDGIDEMAIKLNSIINKCVVNAQLYAHREIKWR